MSSTQFRVKYTVRIIFVLNKRRLFPTTMKWSRVLTLFFPGEGDQEVAVHCKEHISRNTFSGREEASQATQYSDSSTFPTL